MEEETGKRVGGFYWGEGTEGEAEGKEERRNNTKDDWKKHMENIFH